jgi:probable F420-dependent oxidoreductase
VRPFRFGVAVNKVGSGRELVDLARRVEDLGYSTVFVSDHYLDRDLPEIAVMHVAPLAAMAAMASATRTLRIGCRVFGVDYHMPVSLAKEAATIDLISDGRLEFGIGGGWSEKEYVAMGLDFASGRDRIDKLTEFVAFLKQYWSGQDVSCHGSHLNVTGFAGLPLPVQKPHPPIIIGGSKRRVLSLAAREADIVSFSKVDFVAINEDGLTPREVAESRLRFVKETAGDRFDALDLESSPYYTTITERIDEALAGIADRMRCPERILTDHPSVMIGPPGAVVEQLMERRQAYGVNYVTVPQEAMESFAPIAADLVGR